jgi:hypothetical protein
MNPDVCGWWRLKIPRNARSMTRLRSALATGESKRGLPKCGSPCRWGYWQGVQAVDGDMSFRPFDGDGEMDAVERQSDDFSRGIVERQVA